jgi:hypothetical protein
MFGKLFKKKKVYDEVSALSEKMAYGEIDRVSYREFNELREQFLALTNYMGVRVYKPYGYKVEENGPVNSGENCVSQGPTTFTVAMR